MIADVVPPKQTRPVNMLCGNPTDFAIEAMTEPNLWAPSAVWGRMPVVCDKQIYGDYENPHCALYPAYCQFRWFRENVIELWESSFNGLSNSELHDLLDHAFYGDDDRNTQGKQKGVRNLCFGNEIFNKWFLTPFHLTLDRHKSRHAKRLVVEKRLQWSPCSIARP